jgi:hypothetical protein
VSYTVTVAGEITKLQQHLSLLLTNIIAKNLCMKNCKEGLDRT